MFSEDIGRENPLNICEEKRHPARIASALRLLPRRAPLADFAAAGLHAAFFFAYNSARTDPFPSAVDSENNFSRPNPRPFLENVFPAWDASRTPKETR
jgi:hypothetical protein